LKSKNQPILQLAQYSIQTKSEEDMVLEYNLMGALTMALQKFLCISYTKIQQEKSLQVES
jgi:hypothetical protein